MKRRVGYSNNTIVLLYFENFSSDMNNFGCGVGGLSLDSYGFMTNVKQRVIQEERGMIYSVRHLKFF